MCVEALGYAGALLETTSPQCPGTAVVVMTMSGAGILTSFPA